MGCYATAETLKFYLLEELFFLSGNHKTATKSLKRGIFGGMSSIVLASNRIIRDNVLSGGHYPKINPDWTNRTLTRSGGVLFRPEGIYKGYNDRRTIQYPLHRSHPASTHTQHHHHRHTCVLTHTDKHTS